jgi:hypothetical protein
MERVVLENRHDSDWAGDTNHFGQRLTRARQAVQALRAPHHAEGIVAQRQSFGVSLGQGQRGHKLAQRPPVGCVERQEQIGIIGQFAVGRRRFHPLFRRNVASCTTHVKRPGRPTYNLHLLKSAS